MGKFCFETKVLTFFGKGTSLSFYEKGFFFFFLNVKSIKNVLILRKKARKIRAFFYKKSLLFKKGDSMVLMKTMVFIHLLRIQDSSFAMIKKRVFIRTGFKLENHL